MPSEVSDVAGGGSRLGRPERLTRVWRRRLERNLTDCRPGLCNFVDDVARLVHFFRRTGLKPRHDQAPRLAVDLREAKRDLAAFVEVQAALQRLKNRQGPRLLSEHLDRSSRKSVV